MKWLFFTLLLFNMGFAVWSYPQSHKSETEISQAAGREELLFLSEADLEVEEQIASDEMTMEAAKSSKDEVPQPEEYLAEHETSAEEPPVREMSSTSTPAESGNDLSVLMVPEPLFTPEIVDSDLDAEQRVLHCGRMGPVGKRSQADQLSLRLTEMGLQPEVSTETSNTQEGYWVLVPPQKNRAAAVKIVKRLQQEGVKDLWRFTNGSLAHAISLGLFRHESRAEIRRKEVADKGFDVEVRPRYREQSLYWLDYSYSGDSPFTEESWMALAEDYPELENRDMDCQEIASQ